MPGVHKERGWCKGPPNEEKEKKKRRHLRARRKAKHGSLNSEPCHGSGASSTASTWATPPLQQRRRPCLLLQTVQRLPLQYLQRWTVQLSQMTTCTETQGLTPLQLQTSEEEAFDVSAIVQVTITHVFMPEFRSQVDGKDGYLDKPLLFGGLRDRPTGVPTDRGEVLNLDGGGLQVPYTLLRLDVAWKDGKEKEKAKDQAKTSMRKADDKDQDKKKKRERGKKGRYELSGWCSRSSRSALPVYGPAHIRL
ncbi:hypothetical protein OEZ85_003282 [Tetradesmus obliquus]|uniref:Uncharacterized protein n=1 Tax=Tetradesmus obliquus TaxID=3088 RepID=A0ABY8U2E6_TETOB|nr:hypothetical protein OEZ85_003282 [Tetradesmus obliquus]